MPQKKKIHLQPVATDINTIEENKENERKRIDSNTVAMVRDSQNEAMCECYDMKRKCCCDGEIQKRIHSNAVATERFRTRSMYECSDRKRKCCCDNDKETDPLKVRCDGEV